MDVRHPDTDGLQLTQEFSADPDLGTVPIVAVTALNIDHERILAAGCDACVSKPIDRHVPLTLVKRYLDPSDQES
jgi:two-component system cell cycle response regulator DivK